MLVAEAYTVSPFDTMPADPTGSPEPVQVDGCDPRHAEAGELARRGDGRAVERRRHLAERSVARLVERTRHPVVDGRLRDDLLVALQRTVLVEPELVGMDERQASGERRRQHESRCSIDRSGRDQVTFEVTAVQQRRRSSRRLTSYSDTTVSTPRVRLRRDQQARAVEQQLVAAIGNVELRDHLRAGNVDDPHTVLRCDEHVRAVGLDDVTLVDSDLLRVRAREVRRRRSRAALRRPLSSVAAPAAALASIIGTGPPG